MNITRKIKIIIIDNEKVLKGKKFVNYSEEDKKELRNSQYKFIRDSQYAQYRALNIAMGNLMAKYYECNMDLKDERFLQFQKDFMYNLSNPAFEDIKFGRGVDTLSAVNQAIKSDFSTGLDKGIAKGERNINSYKRNYPLLTRGRDLKFAYENENSDEIIIDWANGIRFKCILGWKKNSDELKHTLHKVLNREYKVCGSSIMFNKRNEMILNLSIKVPEKKVEVIKDRTLGVDVGLAIPAYVSISDDQYTRSGFGCYEEFAKTRQQFKARRKRLQRQLALVKGGKGRKKKLHNLEYLEAKEKDFAKTYNHQLSRKIVDFAIKNQCEFINIEKINSETMDKKLLSNWGYYQLQQQIEYKAKLVGIETRQVEAKNTSRTCSKCGFVHEDNRKSQANFVCLECGFEINADWNAAINISRSNKFVK
ncbi:MAG: RNA-guided endonuclease InsQ/TnpB family protein [Sarcina sp.]